MTFMSIFTVLLTITANIVVANVMSRPKYKNWITIVVWCVYAALFLMTTVVSSAGYRYIVGALGLMAIYLVMYEGKIGEKIFLITSYQCFFCAYIGTLIFFDTFVFYGKVYLEVILRLILISTSIFLILKIVPAFKNYVVYIESGWISNNIVMSIYYFTFMLQILLMDIGRTFSIDRIAVFFITIGIFILCYIMVLNGIKDRANLNKTTAERLSFELFQTQFKTQYRQIEEARRIRHDMRHHAEMVMALAEKGDTKGIIEYLSDDEEQNTKVEVMHNYCKNETINNIYNYFDKKAKDNGVKADLRAQCGEKCHISSPVLVIIIANILENAIMGASESESSDSFLTIDIVEEKGKLKIKSRHRCLKSFINEINDPNNIKGINASNITTTVNKNNGFSKYGMSNGIFSCEITV